MSKCKCPHCSAIDRCDECDEHIPNAKGIYEVTIKGKDKYVCHECFMSLVDEAEARMEGER